jgi:LuxR family maltose regulon positive regulatory protein
VPLDNERVWYRYHHLFADLLRARLDQVFPGLAPRLHLRAAAWYERNGLILEAIQHASIAPDDELVERLIEQHYMEMVNRGEMSQIRDWMGRLSKELIYRRPWLCLYEALSRSWFGELDEANSMLDQAEKRIQEDVAAPGAQAMLGYHAYVKSRVTAMQGDTRRAIELCLKARESIPADNLGLQNDVSITLGYEYFLYGDFANAEKTLLETIRSGYTAGAINNAVASYALLARAQFYQGHLHEAHDNIQKASKLIREAGGQYLGVTGLVEIGIAALSYEWNDLEASIAQVKRGLELLPMWGKSDDTCLAYVTLWQTQLALGNRAAAEEAIEKAAQLVHTSGLFSEARNAVEAIQVENWMAQGDLSSINRWTTTLDKRFDQNDPFRFEDELIHITRARIYLAQKKLEDAIRLLAHLEVNARSAGRSGRLIEIKILEALARQALGETSQAESALAKSLALAEPEGYLRIFLEEGQPMQELLARWLSHAGNSPLRDYASRLLSQFEVETRKVIAAQKPASQTGGLVDPLSQRELEVLRLIALGRTNQEVAGQLVVSRGTVKAHTASIYRKLDVANRTEAVARARQLGILP